MRSRNETLRFGTYLAPNMLRVYQAIAEHVADSRLLRVFDGVAGTVTYVGQFRLDRAPYQTDAPESEDAPSRGRVTRQVFVFPLRPIDIPPQPTDPSLQALIGGPAVVQVPIEQQNTERAVVNPSGET